MSRLINTLIGEMLKEAAELLASTGTATPNGAVRLKRIENKPPHHKGALSTRHIKPYFRQNERY